jgi:hypothetical protein
MKMILATLASALIAQVALAVEPCGDLPKSKSRQIFESKALMPSLLVLEGRGEQKFHLSYAAPATQCLAAKFPAAGGEVEALNSPVEKGELTLHWLFRSAGAEPRDILVFYDGMASLMAKKEVFFLAEERQGNIAYYAMFRDPPTLAVLQPLVTGILEGSVTPLAKVRWPAGAKEPVIDAYDSKRLK